MVHHESCHCGRIAFEVDGDIGQVICPTCGCAPFGFGADPSGAPTAAVNLRCLENVELSAVTRMPFDGRSL
jgi:hypothetical protein